MATRQLTFTHLFDDGLEVDATVEVRGTDEQIESLDLGEIGRRVARRPGPRACRPALPAHLALPAKAG